MVSQQNQKEVISLNISVLEIQDLSDKCDELQQEIKELKYEQLREYGLKFKNSLKKLD